MGDWIITPHYTPLYIGSDLSTTALEEAIRTMKWQYIYTLHVHKDEIAYAASMLKGINGDARDNPLAPYINLTEESCLKRGEWVLERDGVLCGSVL